MKKEGLLIIAILIISSISAITIPQTCSVTSIRNTWNSVFIESSVDTTTITSGTLVENRCEKYFIYKQIGDYTYFLYGEENSLSTNSTFIKATKVNTTTNLSEYIPTISSINDVDRNFFKIADISRIRPTPLTPFQLNSEFSNTFSEEPTSWLKKDLGVSNDETYIYTKTSSETDSNTTKEGQIALNHSYVALEFKIRRIVEVPQGECLQDWDCSDWGNCINNTQIRVCIDLNLCNNNTGKPEEITNCTNTNCTPSWNCTNWTSCTNKTKTRNCTDLNNCNAKKIETIECGCLPEWNCTDWVSCIGGIQTRTCIDINSCNNETNKPITNESCGPTCVPDWNCTDWTPQKCPSDTKTKTRTCTDLKNCGSDYLRPDESKSCSNDFGWAFWFIVVTIIILISGLSWMLIEKRKKDSENKFKEEYHPPITPKNFSSTQQPRPKSFIPGPPKKRPQPRPPQKPLRRFPSNPKKPRYT